MKKFKHIHHVDFVTINEMYGNFEPVFILSTGRSGTKFLSTLFALADNIKSYHEAPPGLQYFVNYAFHNQWRNVLLKKMIDAARMELVLDAYIKDKIYIETNQCLTFFSYQLKELFKASKFLHVVRHPGDFIASAVGKGWFRNDSLWEKGRIRIRSEKLWSRMDQIEKLAWLWQTTNHFAEDFKKTLPQERFLSVKIEDLFNDIGTVIELIDFVGGKGVSSEEIVKLQETKINPLEISEDEPPNMFKRDDFPDYPIWTANMVEKIKPYVTDLSALYRYAL